MPELISQDFLDSLQKRLRLHFDPDLSLELVCNNVTLDKTSGLRLAQETKERVQNIIRIELCEYHKIDERLKAYEMELEEGRKQAELEKEKRRILQIEDDQHRRKRAEHMFDIHRSTRLRKQNIELNEKWRLAEKMVASYGTLVDINLKYRSCNFSAYKQQIDDYVLVSLCSSLRKSRVYVRNDLLNPKKNIVESKFRTIHKIMKGAYLNGYYGLLDNIGEEVVQGKIRTVFRLNENSKICENFVYRENGKQKWSRTYFLISDENESIFCKKRHMPTTVTVRLFLELYKRYRSFQKLSNNTNFIDAIRNYLDYLWRPFGVMANKGFDNCQEINKLQV